MTPKKSPEADLQNKRMLFLLVGLVIALGITGLAFSIHSKPEAGEYTPPKRETTEMEQIDNTRQDQMETPPEPQKAQAQVVTDVLNIVSNDQKIDTNIVFADDADEFDDFEMVIEEKEEEIVEEEIFITVEEMPKFRGGGLPEFRTWVQQNVKYPQIALENGIQGNVVQHGAARAPQPRGKNSRSHVPGKQRGKPVKVSFTLPVAFKIQN